MDLWGPYKVPTMNGNKYFLTVVDDFSRFTWVFLLKLKLDVFCQVQKFLMHVKTQFGKKVKVIRTDNGTEFVNSLCQKLFQDNGIIHQTTCPYSPQQNGFLLVGSFNCSTIDTLAKLTQLPLSMIKKHNCS